MSVTCLEEEIRTHLVTKMTPNVEEANGKCVPHLESFSDGFKQIGDNRVVPQVGEPHPRAIHIDGAGQEEPGAWGAEGKSELKLGG